MRVRYLKIILVIISALVKGGCADFEVQVADDPRKNTSVVKQELSGDHTSSTDGRASFITDLNPYQSAQNSSPIGSSSRDLSGIYGVDLMGIDTSKQATLFAISTHENNLTPDSVLVLKSKTPESEKAPTPKGCGILSGQSARASFPSTPTDLASVSSNGYFKVESHSDSFFKLPSINYQKTIHELININKKSSVKLSGATNTEVRNDIDLRIMNNHIYRSDENLSIHLRASSGVSKMIVDFYGSTTAKTPMVRCVGKPGTDIVMSQLMQQLMIPLKGISVSEVTVLESQDLTEVKVHKQLYQ